MLITQGRSDGYKKKNRYNTKAKKDEHKKRLNKRLLGNQKKKKKKKRGEGKRRRGWEDALMNGLSPIMLYKSDQNIHAYFFFNLSSLSFSFNNLIS